MKSLFIFALALVHLTNALYFHVVEGQQKCFIEEVPEDTLIVGTYTNADHIPYGTPQFNGVGVSVTVTDPSNTNVLVRSLEAEGKFALTTQLGGEYLICFATNSTRWFGQPKKFRVDLRLDVGEMGIDYDEVAKKEHLSELEVEVRRLNDKVKGIMKEQAFQEFREVEFRNTSESTNSRVMWWSLFQLAVMASSTIFSVLTLKKFFKDKKIV